MEPIIEIKGISKKYFISHERQSYLSLRDSITSVFNKKNTSEEFWALKDISFDIFPGDSVGIIGKNGAGKSTLLKILSKITPPTKGKILSRGRIASLLEVGTGFHPELTGRENVFLNGSILGMKRKEIQSKFDEIIDFSGVEKFLDTPLKHYSSGMQLRLAFAVAAFLEPEILVIDEVLAVGDAEFQKKCMGKMEEVTKSGRTILFVSHNLAAVEVLCNKAMMLDKGILINQGTAERVIADYIKGMTENNTKTNNGLIYFEETEKKSIQPKLIKKAEILCDEKLSANQYMGCNMKIKVYFDSEIELKNPVLGITFKDVQNTYVTGINNQQYVKSLNNKPLKKGYISMEIPYLQLMPGIYFADLYFGDQTEDLDIIHGAFSFYVEEKDFSGTGNLPLQKLNKFFSKDVSWKLESL